MKRGFLAVCAVAAALSSVGCMGMDVGGGAFRESVDVSRPLDAAGELSIENTNGTVRVASWDEPRVRIEAEKAAGTRRALDAIEVRVEGEGDRVSVESRHPRGPWFSGRGKVDYTITMPRGARLRVKNVNGRVEIRRVDGAVDASTVNGSLEADDLGGPVEARTVNGSVEVGVARVAASSTSSLRTTNGSVRLRLPSDAAAEIDASTVNGSAHCDFDLQDGARVTRRRVEGRIGSGGARFELGAVNGSLHVDKGFATAVRQTPGASELPAEAAPAAR
jgi:hypothetical protein